MPALTKNAPARNLRTSPEAYCEIERYRPTMTVAATSTGTIDIQPLYALHVFRNLPDVSRTSDRRMLRRESPKDAYVFVSERGGPINRDGARPVQRLLEGLTP